MTDLALINGRIWTGRPSLPWAEAVAITGDRITAVGSSDEIKDHVPSTGEIIGAGGRLILPGFIDCHTHFLAGGFGLSAIQLRDAASREEFALRIKQKAGQLGPGRWITQGSWDHQRFDPPELPRREWIDAVTPRNPVCVNRLDCHMVLANGLALELAGISRSTASPSGGEIIRDQETGEPTGILKDAAMELVTKIIPEPDMAEKIEAAGQAFRHAAENGVTSVHEMADASSLEVYQEIIANRGALPVRINVYIPITEVGLLSALKLKSPFGGLFLKIGGLKGFSDGSLGSSTACFFEPYSDDPSTSGLFHEQMYPEGIMEKRVREADRAGLQVAIHAIGDRANKTVLDIFEKVMSESGPRDRRWRIEHAQHLRPADVERFGRLDVIASVQPYHQIDDSRWAEKKIGPARAEWAYAFKSLLDSGARLAFGSDWTVAPLDPLAGIYAAVTRRTLDGKKPGGWYPEQKLTVEQAVRGYTVDAAYAEFAENEKGSLAPGMLADLVVVDRDIFRIPAEEIAGAGVVMTMVGGRVVFRRGL